MTGSPAFFRRFPATTLPWVVAASSLVVYSLTLNPWISLGSVQQVARLSGWLWEPTLGSPLYVLATLPLRALPETWIPAALNLFNALCAAATLGLLVRSVAILPHNRTHDQRMRCGSEGEPLAFRTAWLPPVVAAMVCGLQLTFWEHATTGTQEMLDLLLFAYGVRCLLEFRLDGRNSWLFQTAFLCGAGMANNYAIVGFFPLYIVALVWLKGWSFFRQGFLVRMTLLGLLGTSLYLILPLLQSQNADLPVGFWQSLKYTLAAQKSILLGFPKKTLLLLSLFSLVPLLLISIRWPQAFGDLSPQGAVLTTLIVHIAHGAFLLLCIWVAFDPPVSPRHAGLGMPFLPLYYLGAVVVGYLIGYFQVVFGQRPETASYTYGRSRRAPWRKAVVASVWILAAITGAGLVMRNLPQIRMTNSPLLRDYASLIVEQIPEGDTVVLSDDATREFLLRSALAERGNRRDVILLNTGSLTWPQYHQLMAARHPDRWPVPAPTNRFERVQDGNLVQLMVRFSQSNQICYAHPSFGYYFEYFDPVPAGILNRLRRYEPGELFPRPLTVEEVTLNEAFWDQSAVRLLSTIEGQAGAVTATGLNGDGNPLVETLHLEEEPNQTAEIVAGWLSRSLNSYGVALQRAGFLEEAATRFGQAMRLNPDNVAAEVNLQFNGDLQAGRSSSVNTGRIVEEKFARYRGNQMDIMQQVINANGLFDEPRLTMALAEILLRGRLFRQALTEFDRARQLLPQRLAPRLWCARLMTLMGQPDQALQIVEHIRNEPGRFQLGDTNQTELLFVEATAHLAKGEQETAVRITREAIAEYPSQTNLVNAALRLYLQANLLDESLRLVEQQLERRPDDVSFLVNKGFVLLRMTNQAPAVEVLTRALELQSNNAPARLNRAIANLKLENLDAAQEDYETLLLQFPDAHPLYYGLGEIAFRRGDTNQAIHNYRLYLSNAPPRTAEAQAVRERLESLAGRQP